MEAGEWEDETRRQKSIFLKPCKGRKMNGDECEGPSLGLIVEAVGKPSVTLILR